MPLRGMIEKSAVWSMSGKTTMIKWEETSVLDRARGLRELLLKEGLHKQMTPAEEHRRLQARACPGIARVNYH